MVKTLQVPRISRDDKLEAYSFERAIMSMFPIKGSAKQSANARANKSAYRHDMSMVAMPRSCCYNSTADCGQLSGSAALTRRNPEYAGPFPGFLTGDDGYKNITVNLPCQDGHDTMIGMERYSLQAAIPPDIMPRAQVDICGNASSWLLRSVFCVVTD